MDWLLRKERLRRNDRLLRSIDWLPRNVDRLLRGELAKLILLLLPTVAEILFHRVAERKS